MNHPFKTGNLIDEALLERVRNERCVACTGSGFTQLTPTDPHHVDSKGAHGRQDREDNVMPLCRQHHNMWDAPWNGPAYMIRTYPGVRKWLEDHGRQDVIEKIERKAL